MGPIVIQGLEPTRGTRGQRWQGRRVVSVLCVGRSKVMYQYKECNNNKHVKGRSHNKVINVHRRYGIDIM